ncbi:MAG: hypothetical protein J6V43_04310 [Rikenellaceae bacterium]|nr:hypothetical protein [Rikenellaceae bacterium]
MKKFKRCCSKGRKRAKKAQKKEAKIVNSQKVRIFAGFFARAGTSDAATRSERANKIT